MHDLHSRTVDRHNMDVARRPILLQFWGNESMSIVTHVWDESNGYTKTSKVKVENEGRMLKEECGANTQDQTNKRNESRRKSEPDDRIALQRFTIYVVSQTNLAYAT